MPSPIYQYVVNLIVGLTIRGGPGESPLMLSYVTISQSFAACNPGRCMFVGVLSQTQASFICVERLLG